MKRIKCLYRSGSALRDGDTPVQIDAYLAAPGLAVHQGICEGKQIAKGPWYIVHVPTGWSVSPRCINLASRQDAARMARCFAEHIDWNKVTLKPNSVPSYKKDILPIVERFNKGHEPAVAAYYADLSKVNAL